MDKQQAKLCVKKTFENPFDKESFLFFIKNLLKEIEEKTFIYSGVYIPDAFSEHINSLERIGKFYDINGHEIDILIVKLKKETTLEKARTLQRNFIRWYLNGSRRGKLKDAALVAFVAPSYEDWRFSLVKMDYKFDENGKIKEELTPARRWSFLVGKNEKSHTAQSRFVPLLERDDKPTLQDLEEAFSIETISDEFFRKYRDLFIKLKVELDKILEKDPKVKSEFQEKNISTVDFAKKLLGQILFLYFLQKKGWLGVKRNQAWGSGSKNFIRELFEKKHGDYKNFFNDILEPLFYEALRTDRSADDHYYSRFDCKIPFLDGGLFDPMNGYDWVNIDINLPDELFSNNNRTPEGDIGDGILDIFDRYNFTVKEDEPLEKEVAIDPELLGKTYERLNAIREDNFKEYLKSVGDRAKESKFNKEYGVYYTPREIVHYMCQQSLIYYLTNEFEGKIPKEDIEQFVVYGESIKENDARVVKVGRETKEYKFKLPENIRNNAKEIDQKLATIIVCDPAVGSGAFLVGMMSEIIKLRDILSIFIDEPDRTTYRFKRECIENSLYGVDIDSGAIEIAKLRLWLSLIVDEDDIHNIKPLPNLDYKV
ncbi:DNA methyltransferase [Caldicellulosiruptor hydrothermalis]|uniref:DNA methyltransferase n=1 Tax=Caldicellulosiruptor hydrothermalis TaxID=413888 RepID=UPI0003041431|nr:DNA methyltransferase [Caldicellulosiruptor hydrothermalis]